MKVKLTILIIFSFCFSFGFGQNELNFKFKKIIHQTVKRANSKYSLFGIDNALYSKFSSEIKPSDTISFYTTSNVPLCDLNILLFYNLKVAKIKKFQNCKEPTSESVTKISYRFKINKNALSLFLKNKEFLRFRIISIEEYNKEKFGENSFKLDFVVEKSKFKLEN